MAAKKPKAKKGEAAEGGTLLAEPPTKQAPSASASATHVPLECRLTTAQATNLRYALGRLYVLVEREIVTLPKGYDQFETLAAIRKVVEHLE